MQRNRNVTILELKEALEPITREVSDLRVELSADIATIRKIVLGNGSGIGLDEQVRANKNEIDRQRELIKSIPDMDKRLQRIEDSLAFQNKIVWLFIISAGGYIVVEIIKFLIRGIS